MTEALHGFLVRGLLCAALLFAAGFSHTASAQVIFVATTSVTVSRCGDLVVNGSEQCDAGIANSPDYSLTIAGRNCKPVTCQWAPYCGDGVAQFSFGEQCDDGNNTSGDFCSAECLAEAVPTGGGGGGGGGGGAFAGGAFAPPVGAQVSVRGKAYPNSNVNILKDGKVIGVVAADSKADFFFTTSNVSPGTATFGFWAEDSKGLRSVSFSTTFQVIQSAVTTVAGVYIPPTIAIDKRSLKRGDTLKISGSSVPTVKINTVVNSEHEVVKSVNTNDTGAWSLDFDTSVLEDDLHTAKAQFELPSVGSAAITSGFSQSLSFFIGNGQAPPAAGSADLNSDNKVNLIDFSILLFNWNSPNAAGIAADINADGKVNLADFSILLFNWTG